jgi:hypothetical protein
VAYDLLECAGTNGNFLKTSYKVMKHESTAIILKLSSNHYNGNPLPCYI